MRLYKITAHTTRMPLIRETKYVGSKSDGVIVRKALLEEGFMRKEIEEVEIDVPTDKVGLLEWLNKNA